MFMRQLSVGNCKPCPTEANVFCAGNPTESAMNFPN